MKKTVYLFVGIIFLLIFSSCQQINLVDPPDRSSDNTGEIEIVIKGSGVVTDGSLYFVIPDVITELSVENKGPISIYNWNWHFSYNNLTLVGQHVSHQFNLQPPSQTLVTVTGYDSLNRPYSKTAVFHMVSGFDGITPLWQVSKTAVGNGEFDIILAARKGHYIATTTGGYAYIGDPAGSFNTGVAISPSDTNYIVVGANLVAAGSGQIGTHVAVKFRSAPRSLLEMGIGKFRNNNPNDMVWDYFPGPFTTSQNQTLIRAKILSDGSFVPYSVTPPDSLPGIAGDNFVRFGVNALGKLLIFIKTGNATAPFIRLKDSLGVLSSPLPSSAASGFTGWSVRTVNFEDLFYNNLVLMHYGYNVNLPNVYSPNEPLSKYYDSLEQILKAQIIIFNLGKSTEIGILVKNIQ